MPKKLNERGLSLVEILAVLVLIGIFSIIIWRFFFQATEINSREVTQNSLQQEANLIVNTLHQTHTREEILSISTSAEKTQLIIAIKDEDSIIFNRPGVFYEFTLCKVPMVDDTDCFKNSFDVSMDGNLPNPFKIEIKLTSSKHEKINFSTGSTFSKLKGNN